MINYAGVTLLTVFFICAQVFPRQTAITTMMVLGFIFLSPFMV